jgi:radical SAM/Cys-rich protein
MNSVEEKDRKVSLKAKGNQLSDTQKQLEYLRNSVIKDDNFSNKLRAFDSFPLKAKGIEILQINLGYMCNQVCEHCHVDAGPDRKEIMDKATLESCLAIIDSSDVHTVDLTGGAPEMNPHFEWFIKELSNRAVKPIVRSNLTILVSNKKYDHFPELFKSCGVEVIASLPCYTESNTDKQRGDGVFSSSIKALKLLNEVGYGIAGSGLALNLVFNPGGPSIAPDQKALEKDYKTRLKEDFDIVFNQLFTITNLPISRFLDYLLAVGRFEEYMQKLREAFNPATISNVMCRNTVSVKWNGDLYDCDFNQMLDLPLNGSKSIVDIDIEKLAKRPIVVHEHCLGCTAGAGSSCQGALV